MNHYARIVSLFLLIVCSTLPSHVRAEQGLNRSGIVTVQDSRPSLNRSQSENRRPLSAEEKRANQAENELFMLIVSLVFIGLASCTLILFVLGCGSRIVVFVGAADAFKSASIFLAPVVSCFVAIGVGLIFSLDHNRTYTSFWTAIKDNPAAAFVLAVGTLWWTWAIIGTIVSSILHNGLIAGTLVAILKVGATFSLLLIWYGIIMNYNRNDSIDSAVSKIFFLSILTWFGSKFVNGERVMYRRSMMHDHAESFVQA